MEDFANILQRDYGIKPQGKSAPMSSSRAASGFVPVKGSGSQGGSIGRGSSGLPNRALNQSAEDGLGNDLFFGSANTPKTSGRNSYHNSYTASKDSFDDVFGDSLSFGASNQAPKPSIPSVPSYDDIFSTPLQSSSTSSASRSNSFPVFDMPKYDDDIFGGVPGVRSSSTSAAYEDVFGMGRVASSRTEASDDLLGGFGVAEPSRSKPQATASPSVVEDSPLEELLPGFGSSEPAKKTSIVDGKPSQSSRSNPRFSVADSTLRSAEINPFSELSSDPNGLNSSFTAGSTFVDPLDPFEMQLPRAHDKVDANLSSKANGNNVNVSNVFDGFPQALPSEAADIPSQMPKATKKDEDITPPLVSAIKTDLPEEKYVYSTATNDKVDHFPSSPPRKEANDYFSSTAPVTNTLKKRTVRFDEPALKKESPELSQTFSPDVEQNTEEVWVTIDNVRLVTKPTTSLPPSRPAPRLDPDRKRSPAMRKSEFDSENTSTDYAESVHDYLKNQSSFETASRVPKNFTSSIEDLEQFASGGFQSPPEGIDSFLDKEEQAPATKMKEASERVDAKLKAAKEGREKDREEKDTEAKAAKLKEEREEREKEARMNQDREAREEREKERQRREREREREKDRAAVERATQEVRERAAEKAAAEARERAERAAAEAQKRAERAAVERATAEARERAAAEAREKAAAEARERAAAAEARERAAAERAAAERAAVERATAEARARAERAAVERATAEARERAAERAAVERAAAEARERAEKAAERAAVQRAAAEARERAEKAAAERAAAAAREKQQQQQRRNDNDLESFFNMSGSRAASAPKQRLATSDFVPEQKVFSTDGQRKSPAAPTVRKVSSTTHISDDWTSLFATPPTADFQEIDGEAPERRKARWDRQQRTQERAAKALAEKNQRDLDVQREQAEKHRAAETLDAEIRRWAAGKEGNLRALLSTLQYVLWPECGWHAVSLTDLITAAAVKKVYRKATLYVHPDKVQQKGATVQQKYVAEKVFDLLKEAWNKFNSEELF